MLLCVRTGPFARIPERGDAAMDGQDHLVYWYFATVLRPVTLFRGGDSISVIDMCVKMLDRLLRRTHCVFYLLSYAPPATIEMLVACVCRMDFFVLRFLLYALCLEFRHLGLVLLCVHRVSSLFCHFVTMVSDIHLASLCVVCRPSPPTIQERFSDE